MLKLSQTYGVEVSFFLNNRSSRTATPDSDGRSLLGYSESLIPYVHYDFLMYFKSF